MNKSGHVSDGREMASTPGPKDSESERAPGRVREEGESEEEIVQLPFLEKLRFAGRKKWRTRSISYKN